MSTTTAVRTPTAKGSRNMPITIPKPSSDPTSDVKKLRDEALSHHLTGAKSAIYAAAGAYLYQRGIWGSKDLGRWEDQLIERLNSEIKKHNDQLDLDKKRSTDLVCDKLSEEDQIYVAKTDQEKQEAAKEEARLREIAKRGDKQWKALRRVKVDQRQGASPFTRTTKLVFKLDRATDAPTISRYANVLDWIHDRFEKQLVDSLEPIVAAMEQAGGFEACLEEQRSKKPGEKTKGENADTSGKMEAVRNAVEVEEAKATVEVTLDSAEGLVLVVGRYAKKSLEVVRTLNIADGELDELLLRYAADAVNKD
jgi:hypothetical protein